MTVENKQLGVRCVSSRCRTYGPESSERCDAGSPGPDEARRHMKVSLVNPRVPEVLHAWRELTQRDLPDEPTTRLDLVRRMLTQQEGH
jgi:hypothetical protein